MNTECNGKRVSDDNPAEDVTATEVAELKARIAFLEMALDQAITLTEMELCKAGALPECIQWSDDWSTHDMTHVDQLGVYLEEKK